MAQLTDEQMQQCDAAIRIASPKVVGISSNGQIDFFASHNPTQAEQDAAIAVMEQFVTLPEFAYVKIDTDH